jgi:hypothetical protein
MSALALAAGATAYLVPKTLGCPSASWSMPRVTVVSTASDEWVVRLESGEEIRTHRDNVTRTRPATPRPRARPAAPAVELPPGYEEIPLW